MRCHRPALSDSPQPYPQGLYTTKSVAEDAFGGWRSGVLIQSRDELQSLLMVLRTGGDGEGPLSVGLVVSCYQLLRLWLYDPVKG